MGDWKDGIAYLGGSEAAEAKILQNLGDLVGRQVAQIRAATDGVPRRPQHAKTLAATDRARFTVAADLADDLRRGFLVPGAVYRATLRFSNAGALVTDDRNPDLRGLAARVHVDDPTVHDFLGTNAERHHARNAYEALWASYCLYRPGAGAKAAGILRLMTKVGLPGALRIVGTLAAQLKRPVVSLATDTFWSRSPYRFGLVVGRFRLRALGPAEALAPSFDDLGDELALRLAAGPVDYALELQRYQDEARTPLEDSTVAWPTGFEPLGIFRLDQGTSLADRSSVEPLGFSPWNVAGPDFEPLGNMNRARKLVYRASQKARSV